MISHDFPLSTSMVQDYNYVIKNSMGDSFFNPETAKKSDIPLMQDKKSFL